MFLSTEFTREEKNKIQMFFRELEDADFDDIINSRNPKNPPKPFDI